MKLCSRCKTLKPLSEFGHYRTKIASACYTCERARYKQRRINTPGDALAKAERERYLARKMEPGFLERRRETAREWRQKNKPKTRQHRAARRARMAQATPCWADKAQIDEIYTLAARQKEVTGEDVHVDHIVPLRSKLVCGLHVPANLQIVLGSYNSRKTNRDWPGKP